MANTLSKLHVRFIQSQTHFFVDAKQYPLNTLYIKDNGHFYLAQSESILENTTSLQFKTSTNYLKALTVDVDVVALNPSHTEYEEAQLFFQLKPEQIQHMYLLTITEIKS